MKHFETIWTEAEDLTKELFSEPLSDIISDIKEDLDNIVNSHDQNDRIELMGLILLNITYISEKLKINVYAALKNQIDNLNLNKYDPDGD